jgi:hypothetical protein
VPEFVTAGPRALYHAHKRLGAHGQELGRADTVSDAEGTKLHLVLHRVPRAGFLCYCGVVLVLRGLRHSLNSICILSYASSYLHLHLNIAVLPDQPPQLLSLLPTN